MSKVNVSNNQTVKSAVSQDLYDKIQTLAKQNHTTASVYIRRLLELCIDLPIKEIEDASRKRKLIPTQFLQKIFSKFSLSDDNFKTIILKVPTEIVSDKDRLVDWFEARINEKNS